jgi:outer membrane autotransporter protein
MFSSFDYEDSQGNSLEGLSGTWGNALMIGYRAPIAKEKWFINAGVSLNEYGAKGGDIALDNYYAWDVTYLGANVGVDYNFLQQRNFFTNQDGLNFYLKAALSTEFLMSGTQRINNQLYDLKGEEQFDKPLVFLRVGVGANYCVSQRLAVFLQYLVGKSFPVFGQSSGDNEKLQYFSHTINFGLLLNLPRCKYCDRTFQ